MKIYLVVYGIVATLSFLCVEYFRQETQSHFDSMYAAARVYKVAYEECIWSKFKEPTP
jgi:hypothetical protein